jgi:DNA-binding CsgD family transcriptional regulator
MSGLGADLEVSLLELHRAREVGPFWAATKRLIESALPVHFTGLYLRPARFLRSASLGNGSPFRDRAERQRFEELNPISPFFDANPGTVAVRLSDILPEAELLESEFYRCYLAPEKGRYLACLCFRRREVVQALIGLHRPRRQRDFSETEMHLIEQLYPHIDVALRRVLAGQRERTERLLLETLVSHLPLASVLLGWDLSVLFCNEQAKEMAATWQLGPRRARSVGRGADLNLPREIFLEARKLKALWRSSRTRDGRGMASRSTITIRHPQRGGLRITLRLLEVAPHSLLAPGFLVLFDDDRQALRFDHGAGSNALSRLACLSRREQEVVLLACDGQSDKEIAVALGKSPLTVKKQLHSVYRKLEIPGRGKLTSLLLQ